MGTAGFNCICCFASTAPPTPTPPPPPSCARVSLLVVLFVRYPFLIPGQDHLYVFSDLSNLRAQFDWAEANPTTAAEIAELGRRKALYFGRQDVQVRASRVTRISYKHV